MGSRLVAFATRERYGSDERVGGGETVGNSLGEGCWEGTDGSDDWVDGEETVELRGEGARWKRREGGRGEIVGFLQKGDLHTETFTHRRVYTQEVLHIEAFTAH